MTILSNPSLAPLHTLSTLISSSIASLDTACTNPNISWPSLSEPSYASIPAPGAPPGAPPGKSLDDLKRLSSPDIAEATATIVSAALMLVAMVREPELSVIVQSCALHTSSAILAVSELHVVDMLRDTGPEGLHVDDIAKKVSVDPAKLARILRLLATQHIFSEIKPDVFANNRLSAVLDKGKDIDDLLKNPAGKYDKPESALAALVGHSGDEVMKSSCHLFDSLVNPHTAFSGSPAHGALALSPDLNPAITQREGSKSGTMITSEEMALSFWDMVARKTPPTSRLGFENERLRRFGVAMRAVGNVHPVYEVLNGFDFASLPPSSVLYDVGGGVGAVSMHLARNFGGFDIVIQDRKEVCEEGVDKWKQQFPEAMESGRVTFQAHDFFAPQPPPTSHRSRTVYLLKHILHDWSNEHASLILRRLREAAGCDADKTEETRLLVLDNILPYATHGVEGESDTNINAGLEKTIPGVYGQPARAPLLANWGGTSTMGYFMDVIMLTLFNGQERTLTQTHELFRKSGWEIVKVTQSQTVGELLSMIEAKPI